MASRIRLPDRGGCRDLRCFPAGSASIGPKAPVAESSSMDFDLTHEQRQILEYGNVVAQKYDRKYWMDCAEKHVFPEALYRQVTDDGFVGTMVPEEYGGA